MYYTTSGAYRRSKMIIDYVNIGLTVVISLIFLAIVILRSGAGILFPIEFALGAVSNGLTAAKNYMNSRIVSGIILTLITVALLLIALICFRVVMR